MTLLDKAYHYVKEHRGLDIALQVHYEDGEEGLIEYALDVALKRSDFKALKDFAGFSDAE
jgi:hypothetical protein